MPLVKRGAIVADRFVSLADDEPVPDDVAVLVPAARFLADSADFAARTAATGVVWPNNKPVSELAPHLDRLALIALVFPNFKDGRAYTQARILRERYGYAGELRATGDVLRDQLVFMVRAGFDAFEVKKEADAKAFSAAVGHYSVVYQPTADGRASALQRRLQDARADNKVRKPDGASSLRMSIESA
jgi:uncharacterized protein (DUF934 family)